MLLAYYNLLLTLHSTVLGVDNSAAMLEAAEKEIDETNQGRLQFQLGSIEEVDKIEGN